jgi:hypothetical protein
LYSSNTARVSRTCSGGIHDSGQPPVGQQFPQQPGVGAVGLRPPLRAAQRGGVRRLGQVRGDAGPVELLDHVPPAGARLHRPAHIGAAGELGKPAAQHLPASRHDPTVPGLAGHVVHPVERQLSTMHVERAYDRHHGTSFSSRNNL